MIDLASERPFRVGRANIDPLSREAVFGGQSERLQPQNLKVLIALARQRGKVVTRDQLANLCWDCRFIGDDVINRAISNLRQFATRAGGFAIETVPKRGYRLIEAGSAFDAANVRWATAAAIGLLISVGAIIWFSATSRDEGAGSPTVSLGLLTALAQDSPAPEVADAARHAIADALAAQGYTILTPGAATLQRSDYTVTGEVVRTGDVMQATVQARHGKTAFTPLQLSAPVQQAGALPVEIGAQLAEAISFKDALLALDQSNRTPPSLRTQLLDQMQLLATGEDALRVYPIAGRLAGQAPNSPLAQMLLAFSTGLALPDLPYDERPLALARGRRAAERAEERAPAFGEVVIPWCLLHSQVRMTDCENRLRAAIGHNQDAPLVAQYLSELLSELGRANEGLQFARLGFAHDRYMPGEIARLLRSLESTGQPDAAETLYDQARQWWPTYQWFFWSRTGGMLEWGDFDRLERFEAEPASQMIVRGFETPTLFAALRNRDLALARRECQETPDPSIRLVLCMLGLARLGDLDGAYTIADKMYPRLIGASSKEEDTRWLSLRDGLPFQYLMGPAAEPMRRDPRFVLLAKRTGLLDYWQSGHLPDFCTVRHEKVCAEISRTQR